jgi:hypothetical protein
MGPEPNVIPVLRQLKLKPEQEREISKVPANSRTCTYGNRKPSMKTYQRVLLRHNVFTAFFENENQKELE